MLETLLKKREIKKWNQLKSFITLVVVFIAGLMGCAAVVLFAAGVSTRNCVNTLILADLAILVSTGISFFSFLSHPSPPPLSLSFSFHSYFWG
jgi:hypothetical protein